MRQLITATAVCGALISATPAAALEVTVEVTNTTNAIYFTPLLIAVHDTSVDLFEVGATADAALQAMAEGGATRDLALAAQKAGGQTFEDGTNVLAPGASTSAQFSIGGHQRLSVVGMLLPSNDGFVGLDSVRLRRGTRVFDANGYDAATEANDELIVGMPGGAPGTPGIPADPGDNAPGGGTGVTGADANDTVHIHRGIIGGPTSDLDETVHRWLNPVARIVVTVSPDKP